MNKSVSLRHHVHPLSMHRSNRKNHDVHDNTVGERRAQVPIPTPNTFAGLFFCRRFLFEGRLKAYTRCQHCLERRRWSLLPPSFLTECEADPRFVDFLVRSDFHHLAVNVRNFLEGAFGGAVWPELRVTEDVLANYDGLVEALVDALNQPMTLGEDVMSDAFHLLATDMADDERVLLFLQQIKEVAAAHVDSAASVRKEGSQRTSEMSGDPVEVVVETSIQHGIAAAEALAQEINVLVFEELHLPQAQVNAAQDGWRSFLSTSASQEAAGEAIYSALFEGAPSLQSLFTTPRAVQAMRFMNGLASFVLALTDPPRLKTLVETLGFGHLHLDVTVPRVVIFRDAILDLFSVELGDRFPQAALDGWKTLLNYVGGAIIFVKIHYAERITLILGSWQAANTKSTQVSGSGKHGSGSGSTGKERGDKMSKLKKLVAIRFKKTGNSASEGDVMNQDQPQEEDETAVTGGVATTYPEMFATNSAAMGFNDKKWMQEVLQCFHNIVTNVSNSARLQEECDVLALRISRVADGSVPFAQYKSCMLATLRAVLPNEWSTEHEVSWSWMWENVERVLMKTMGKPPRWRDALCKFYATLSDETKLEMRADIYARFFVGAPAGQSYFKQSNAYLHIIAARILEMTLELYVSPVKMVDDISALGLRHVGYGIPTELFGPFVSACVGDAEHVH